MKITEEHYKALLASAAADSERGLDDIEEAWHEFLWRWEREVAPIAEPAGVASLRRSVRSWPKIAAVAVMTLAIIGGGLAAVRTSHSKHGSATSPTTTGANKGPTKESSGPTVAQLAAGSWSDIPSAPIAPRGSASVVWTGRELIVWGGADGAHGAQLCGNGATYDPTTKNWRLLPPSPLPPTADASAVWTGTEMVVFGGYVHDSPGNFQATSAAAAYDPSANTWRLLPPAPLSPRVSAFVFWSGHQVVVIGGQPAVTGPSGGDGDGAAFDPSTNAWRRISTPTAPHGHRVQWTTVVQAGHEGIGFSNWFVQHASNPKGTTVITGGSDQFRLDETSDQWRYVPVAPEAAQSPSQAIWTGRDVLVRSGASFDCPVCFGAIGAEITDLYDPADNMWSTLPEDPLAVANPWSLWVGDAVFSFDPTSDIGLIRPGATSLFDLSTGRWSRLHTAPSGCGSTEPMIWTGTQVLIYCPDLGANASSSPSGLVYTPAGLKAPSANIRRHR
jgi:hypothetical protein